VNCVSHTVVENLKQFAFKGDKSRVVRGTFWLIKVVPTWEKFGKRCTRSYSAFGKSLCTYKSCWKWYPRERRCRPGPFNFIRKHFLQICLWDVSYVRSYCSFNSLSSVKRQLRYWRPNLRTVAYVHGDFPNALCDEKTRSRYLHFATSFRDAVLN
jgi:hypothetical protein